MIEQRVPYPSLDIPAVLVDKDTLEANRREMSQLAEEASVRLRPHCKVHENASIAKSQIEAGACGIEVASVGQAEAMAEQGINGIFIAHPGFYGEPKGEILKRLIAKPGLKLTLIVDMLEQESTKGLGDSEYGCNLELLSLLGDMREINESQGGDYNETRWEGCLSNRGRKGYWSGNCSALC